MKTETSEPSETPETSKSSDETDSRSTTGSEDRVAERLRSLCLTAKGFLELIQSVKHLGEAGKNDRLYAMTVKRFRNACLRLQGFAEAVACAYGEKRRDELLQRSSCSWDATKNRVLIGVGSQNSKPTTSEA